DALFGVLFDAMGDPCRLAAVRADDHDLAERQRHRLVGDPTLVVLGRIRLGVALHDVHARYHDLARCSVDFLDLATLAAVAAGDDHDLVALADAQIAGHLEDLLNLAAQGQGPLFSDQRERARRCPQGWWDSLGPAKPGLARFHRTSGGSETIFMKLRSRSSRATGPKMR